MGSKLNSNLRFSMVSHGISTALTVSMISKKMIFFELNDILKRLLFWHNRVVISLKPRLSLEA